MFTQNGVDDGVHRISQGIHTTLNEGLPCLIWARSGHIVVLAWCQLLAEAPLRIQASDPQRLETPRVRTGFPGIKG
jgi:hypothetical protein